ncbi:MAG: phosphonate C-P lyase system protein PhnH [Arenibacterium sp.]
MQAQALAGGFDDAPRDAAYAFRQIMEATARPGTIRKLSGIAPPAPLSPAVGAALLTLCDADTPVYLAGDTDCEVVHQWLAFHTGAPFSEPDTCMFAVGPWTALLPLSAYPIGDTQYPDRSATLIVELSDLHSAGTTLSGPGIREKVQLSLPDPSELARNHARFPLGLDFLFTSADKIAGLPRSTRIHLTEDS